MAATWRTNQHVAVRRKRSTELVGPRAGLRDAPAARIRQRLGRRRAVVHFLEADRPRLRVLLVDVNHQGEARRGGRVRRGIESRYRSAAQRLHLSRMTM